MRSTSMNSSTRSANLTTDASTSNVRRRSKRNAADGGTRGGDVRPAAVPQSTALSAEHFLREVPCAQARAHWRNAKRWSIGVARRTL